EQVEDDGLRRPALDLQARLHAVGGGQHDETLKREMFLQEFQHVRIIVHAEHAGIAIAHQSLPGPGSVDCASRFLAVRTPRVANGTARTVPGFRSSAISGQMLARLAIRRERSMPACPRRRVFVTEIDTAVSFPGTRISAAS